MKIEAEGSSGDFWSECDALIEREEQQTDDALRTAYGLKSPEHSYENGKRCKKNCKTNVRCYTGFGEERWLSPRKPKASSGHNSNKTVAMRDSNFPAGLINLGTTCYVNSCLQLWFNNVWLREAIYEWNPSEDPEEKGNETLNSGQEFKPVSKVGSLQFLFAQMQASSRSALDPRDFVSKLGLDPDIQQDAQEFNKLFLMLLESSLLTQSNTKVRNIVQNQFGGNYAYVTTCSKCKRESRSPSQFSELLLAVQDKRTLQECIDEYLSKEILAGDNKYFCSHCKEKRNASRCIRITKLPPVLNISLNRFVFDMKTGSRKKLNTAIQFPEVLDMSTHLKMSPGKLLYNLTAVLIHIGGNAHRGHYKAQIKNLKSGQWYQYSDTEVELLDTQVGYDCEVKSNGQDVPKKSTGKQLGSTTAYMLVYTAKARIDKLHSADRTVRRSEGFSAIHRTNSKRSLEETASSAPGTKKSRISEPKPIFENASSNCNGMSRSHGVGNRIIVSTSFPNHLQRMVLLDNMKLRVEADTEKADKISADEDRKNLLSQMADVLSKLSFDENSDDLEFLPSSWLRTFVSRPSAIKEICTATFLCKHHNIDSEKVLMLKAVNSAACEKIFEYFPSARPKTRLAFNKLCHSCFRSRLLQAHLNSKSSSDSKIIQDLLKEPVDERSSGNFWIGKRSLQRWKSYAQQIFSEKIEALTPEVEVDGDSEPEYREKSTSSESNGCQVKNKFESEDDFEDNGAHMNSSSNIDEKDDDDDDDDTPSTNLRFNEEIVCPHGKLSADVSSRRLICRDIWGIFRNYFPHCPEFDGKIKSCSNCESSIDRLNNLTREIQELAVMQKNMLGDIFSDRNLRWPRNCIKAFVISKCFVQKWRSWVRCPGIDNQLKSIENSSLICWHKKLLHPFEENFGEGSESELFLLDDAEWEKLSKTFHVDYLITIERHRPRGSTANSLVTYSPEVCQECVEIRRVREEESKLKYQSAVIYIRKIAPNEVTNDTSYRQGTRAQLTPDPVRISQRHQKVQGEKNVRVRSTMTLKELKDVISKIFQVSSSDPVLHMNGVCLNENEKTLADFRVFPDSVVYLVNDDPPQSKSKKNTPRRREEGFKGTGLIASIL